MTPHLPNLKQLTFGGASSVHDPEMDQVIRESLISAAARSALSDPDCQNRFVEKYFSWLTSGTLNQLHNLDQFKIRAFANGTTEGFDKFYITNHSRRFRIFRGEYMYHAASWKNTLDWLYLDQAPIANTDAVIISMPFSDTGDCHVDTMAVLDTCARLSVPVLIDCAFMGICGGIQFDFAHPAITDITFSLSKSFPVAHLRIGMRCRRQDNDDGILIHQKTNYTNRVAAHVGHYLLDRFDMDYNFRRWRPRQLEFCGSLGVTPSASVIFGIGGDDWTAYNRGGPTNRLCFSKYLQGNLPHD